MNKIFKFILSLLIAGLFAGVGIFFMFNRGQSLNSNQEDYQKIYTVTARNISSNLQLSGKVNYLISEDVVFTTNARVKEKLVKDGDRVEKGQMLIRLNEEDLIYALENARVKYINANNKLNEIKNWQGSSSYISSKYQLANASARCEDVEKKYKENLDLYQAKAISKQDLDSSEFELKLARSELEITKAQFTETMAKGDKKAMEEAQSEFIMADIDFRKAKEAMAHKEIFATVSGVITIKQNPSDSGSAIQKLFSENMSVSPGDIFMTISDKSILTLDVQVDEFDVYRVKENQPCKISIPALPGSEFSGHLVSISSVATEASRALYRVRCQIDQLNPTARVGMSGDVEILLEEKRDVLVAPTSALAKKETVTGVYSVESGSPHFCPVKVGLNNGDLAEILEGISAGQKILRIVPANLLNSKSNGT